MANKSKIIRINKDRIGGGANKSRIDRTNKRKIDRTNIETGNKASTRAITSINNSANIGNKIIDKYISIISLVFVIFIIANYADNFNLAIYKKILLNNITFISNKFFITFITCVNITLEK